MTTSRAVGGIALVAALAATGTAHASILNLVTNGGLEPTSGIPLTPYGYITASYISNPSALPGWTILNAGVDIAPTSKWQSTQGSYSVDLVGTTGTGGLQQTISGLTKDQGYELTFDLSVNPDTTTGEGGSTKIVDVLLGNTDHRETFFSLTNGTRTTANMQYVHETVDFFANQTSIVLGFIAQLSTNLPQTLTNGNPATASNIFDGPVIDNVSLVQLNGVVRPPQGAPEPASLSLVGAGAMMLLRRRNRI